MKNEVYRQTGRKNNKDKYGQDGTEKHKRGRRRKIGKEQFVIYRAK